VGLERLVKETLAALRLRLLLLMEVPEAPEPVQLVLVILAPNLATAEQESLLTLQELESYMPAVAAVAAVQQGVLMLEVVLEV
jgi:hypothetical protein